MTCTEGPWLACTVATIFLGLLTTLRTFLLLARMFLSLMAAEDTPVGLSRRFFLIRFGVLAGRAAVASSSIFC